ncbi:hypothetical protein ACHAXT_005312 [Thalassiosira profunda]
MADTATGRCDACGLPPIEGKKLLKCTRCKSARYHDAICQRDHYPKHKSACRRAAAAAAKNAGAAVSNPPPPSKEALVECRTAEGKGRSLFATSELAAGCHPLPSSDGLSAPIAHPVLLESMRNSRCAYCFQPIQDTPLECMSSSFHRHCSALCRNRDKNWMGEAQAARKPPSPPSPTALSCARILRTFQESPSTSEEYNQLCFNVDLLSEDEKESYASIMTQCQLFLCAMGDASAAKVAYDLMHPDPSAAYRFMSRLSLNGFTIANSELLPIGHGIYPGASMINHSCIPNAVPTFWLRASTPPMLQVTTCCPLEVGDEIIISYCDRSAPRHLRSKGLWDSYKFACDCSLCQDAERDDDVVGLKCTTADCKGRVRSKEETQFPETVNARYQCDACGNADFNEGLKALSGSLEKIKRIETRMTDSDDGNGSSKKDGEEARSIYESLKRHCNLHRSYHAAWSADLFVNWCANALKSLADEPEQLALCHEALVVINECRSATKFCFDHPGNLSWHIKRGVEAKLRMFANPADAEALGMLRNVRRELQKYYPPSDEMLSSLDETLSVYSFS